MPKVAPADYKDSKGFKRITSRKLSVVLGSICLIFGLFGCIDNWGPKKVSRETILGFPNGGNVFLIRTENSYFPIDPKLEYETTKMHNVPIDVYKSCITGTPLSFILPGMSAEVFYPLSTIYSYIYLHIICIIAGLVLFLYRKRTDLKMYIVFLSVVALVSAVIPMIALKVTIDEVYKTKTIGW